MSKNGAIYKEKVWFSHFFLKHVPLAMYKEHEETVSVASCTLIKEPITLQEITILCLVYVTNKNKTKLTIRRLAA